jgi:hypothetical protein
MDPPTLICTKHNGDDEPEDSKSDKIHIQGCVGTEHRLAFNGLFEK